MDRLRRIFNLLNRYWRVSIYRMGLDWMSSNPMIGIVRVTKNTWRKQEIAMGLWMLAAGIGWLG